jgi:hypothetical protein
MATVLGALRKLALAPSMDEVTFASRGFVPATSAMARTLQEIPQIVVLGFEFGIEAPNQEEAVARLDMVQREVRGFAYEGAAMAFTIRDAMAARPGGRTARFLAGPAESHVLLAYIGVGFAMARLPRRLWSRILPDLSGVPYDATLSWLVVDGYGFDRAYFDTRRWIDQQYVPPAYPWQGNPGYFRRAADQGIGRALWFIHGAEVPAVTAAVNAFAEARRCDLWAGVGLAATYAGAGDADVLKALLTAAQQYRPELAQGAVFAATARVRGDVVTPHTGEAVQVLCGMTTEEAVALGEEMSPEAVALTGVAPVDTAGGPAVPDYELWRRRLHSCFQ